MDVDVTDALGALLAAESEQLTPEAAKAILSMKPSPSRVRRVKELAGASRRGTLSPAQRAELDALLQFTDFLAAMHSGARVALKRSEGKPRRKTA